MALALDASTPVRWSATVNASSGGTVVSASFTAPLNAVLWLCVEYDSTNNWSAGTRTISDSGGLAWANLVERLPNETTVGGASGQWWAQTTSAVARTVSVALGTPTPGAGGWGTGRVSCKLRVWTGADVPAVFDTVGANNEGGSATNNLTTTTLTAGGDGVATACDTDWNALGVFETSTDLTQDTATYSGAISVCDGYKTVTNGSSVTCNLNAAGTSAAQHKWCVAILRAAATTAGMVNPRRSSLKTLRRMRLDVPRHPCEGDRPDRWADCESENRQGGWIDPAFGLDWRVRNSVAVPAGGGCDGHFGPAA